MAAQQMQNIESIIGTLQNTLAQLSASASATDAKADGLLESVNRLREQARKGHSDHDDRLDSIDASIIELESAPTRGQGQGAPRFWTLDKHSLKTFSSDKAAFKTWSKKLKAHCNGRHAGFRRALQWAESMREPLTLQDLQAYSTTFPQLEDANTKLFDFLVGTCELEAQSIVEGSAGIEQGFEAWRRLTKKFDVVQQLSELERLRQLMTVSQSSSMKTFERDMEKFETMWDRHVEQGAAALPDAMKVTLLLGMLPAREQGEMKLRHAEGELNYATLKANIEAWLKHVDNGLQKMDLSSMEQRAAEGAASKEEI